MSSHFGWKKSTILIHRVSMRSGGVWWGLVVAMDSCSTGTTSLDVMESYKVLVPGSLQCRTLNKPLTFCSSSSRPVTFLGLPKDRCDELLGLLLTNIFNNFRACSRPEDYLARAAEKTKKSEKNEQKVILIGASNMHRASRYFEDSELIFENLEKLSLFSITGAVMIILFTCCLRQALHLDMGWDR
jgi:hypothetical protein